MAEFHEDYYVNLLDKNQSGFLSSLNRNIVKGDNAREETLKQIEVISHHPDCVRLLRDYRDSYGDSLIHNVAKFHKSTQVLKSLLSYCPKLLLSKRSDRFEGQTALHIVVTKGNLKAARVILRSVQSEKDLTDLLHATATGSLFSKTVMMGELALIVAALTLNNNMVDVLIRYKADISEQNSQGDTVFHSLIRFAQIHPEKLDSIINMIKHINSQLPAEQVSKVWYNAKDKDDLTALKLAAALGQVEIFSCILKLEDVYCKLNHHDGLFDIYLFDITEIDTITQAEWERNKMRELGKEKSKPITEKPAAQSHKPALIHRSPAVIDIICRLPTATAFELMNVDVVKDVISTKWYNYRKFYYLWFLWHFLMLSFITVYAVFKTKVINERVYSPSNSSQADPYETTGSNDRFVFAVSVLSVIYALPYLIYEGFRSFYFRQSWHLNVIHHNGLYRLMLVAMSISLIIDAIWFWIHPDNNYFMVAALLIGWTFMNFFLRGVKIFSFFTVMLQKVLLGDMTRFSVIIIFQLIAFSIAMYITFLNTNPVPSGFENLGNTMMTMFKLMLGLTDIEILYDARHPWMAIFLFIACVLVTYVLLINSLIALMSQTCALVSEDRRMQWELQRLSVIHIVETMLLPRWRYLHRPGLKARRYNLDNQATEWRCFNEITSIQTTYTDGAAMFRRKSMIRTLGFGDSGLSPMAPFIDKFRAGSRMSAHFSLPIYQNAASLREDMIAEENENELESSEDESELRTELSQPPKPAIKESSKSPRETEKSNKQTRIHSPTPVQNMDSTDTLGQTEVKEALYVSSLGRTEPIRPQQYLNVETKPRKRHNSERVNRRTQTPNQTHLSHSYPDGTLRTPLDQAESDINPRIVYVVPSNIMNQPFTGLNEMRPIDSNVRTQMAPVQFQANVVDSDNIYAQVIKPKASKASDRATEDQREMNEEEKVKIKFFGKDGAVLPSTSLERQTMRQPAGQVQKLDIDILHSSI